MPTAGATSEKCQQVIWPVVKTAGVETRAPGVLSLPARHRLPAIYALSYFARDGGLVSYGIDMIDQYRGAASYVDRILKGAKPADLPVHAPNKFEPVIHLKTARALGLAVPPSLLARADEVIE